MCVRGGDGGDGGGFWWWWLFVPSYGNGGVRWKNVCNVDSRMQVPLGPLDIGVPCHPSSYTISTKYRQVLQYIERREERELVC